MSKLNLTQTFKAQIGTGEKREITFLANSGKMMSNGDTIDLDTLTTRDPDTGARVLVKNLNASDSKNYLPLLIDHDWSVDRKAGEIRGLWLTDQGLMARATLASNENGDNLLTLAKDDMLDTFSVTVEFGNGEQDSDGVIHNGYLLEISAVWLGNDEKTKLVSVNERKEANMTEIRQNELTADEAQTLKDAISDLQAKVDALTADSGDDGDNGNGEAPITSDGGDDTTPAEPAKNEKTNDFVRVQKNEREAEKESKKTVSQIEVKSNSKSYIDSDDAVRDFARAIRENRGEQAARNAWNKTLKSYALDADILPTSIEQIFFKTWTDQDSILSTFRNSRAKQLDLYAFTPASDEGGRAKGHKKGEVKADQELKTLVRTTRVKGIYKKLPLDLESIVDGGEELVTFRAQELADRVANEIVVSALIGDGRSAATPDLRTFDGARGLFSMKADIDESATADTYASAVATKVEATAGDSLYTSYFKTLSAVHTNGRKVLVVPYGAIAELLTSKDADGRPLFAPGTTPEQIFPSTRVFELEEMVGGELKALAYADGSAYVLNGDGAGRVFTDFDITKNQDVMEVVRYVGGSLQGRKLAAGLVAAAA